MTEFANNKLTDEEIIKRATEELRAPSLAITEEYLAIHDVVRIDGKPKVERLDRDSKTTNAIIYFAVNDEKFHFAIQLSTRPAIEIIGVHMEPDHQVYFRATSETLNVGQLSVLTTLRPTTGWNKGEPRKPGGLLHKFSMIEFHPDPEPDAFEDKLRKLLDFLETDPAGVKELVEQATGHIQVVSHFHNANGMIGGPRLHEATVKRMGDLNLDIDFDLYVGGKPFRDAD